MQKGTAQRGENDAMPEDNAVAPPSTPNWPSTDKTPATTDCEAKGTRSRDAPWRRGDRQCLDSPNNPTREKSTGVVAMWPTFSDQTRCRRGAGQAQPEGRVDRPGGRNPPPTVLRYAVVTRSISINGDEHGQKIVPDCQPIVRNRQRAEAEGPSSGSIGNYNAFDGVFRSGLKAPLASATPRRVRKSANYFRRKPSRLGGPSPRKITNRVGRGADGDHEQDLSPQIEAALLPARRNDSHTL